MDDDPQRSDPVHLANRFDGLEAQVTQLRRDIRRLADVRPKSEDTGLAVDPRRWPSPEDDAVALESLAAWVDRLQEQYAAAGDWLVPCWWRHRFAVNELAALRIAWLGVDTADESSAALDWHEAAEKCRERIRQAIGDGPGCTAVEHYPDRPVTNDARWSEERGALDRELWVRRGRPLPGANDTAAGDARGRATVSDAGLLGESEGEMPPDSLKWRLVEGSN